jgi:hypothetical protein
MKRNKIGSIFLVSVLALAGIGISYAGFFDTIHVYGKVDTATVTLDLKAYSKTYVWKIWDWPADPFDPEWTNPYTDTQLANYLIIDIPGEYAYLHCLCFITPEEIEELFNLYLYGIPNPDWQDPQYVKLYERVAWAYAEAGNTDIPGTDLVSDVDVTFKNIFPCFDFIADFIVHYSGSIPAHLTGSHYVNTHTITDGPNYDATVYTGTNWLEDLWIMKHPYGDGTIDPTHPYGVWFEAWKIDPEFETTDDPTTPIVDYDLIEPVDIGYQVHKCTYIIFFVKMHLPQNNIFQGCYGEFSLDVGAEQWYDPPCGTYVED